MMHPTDAFFLTTITVCAAVWSALGARVRVRELPLLSMVRNPDLFGGRARLVLYGLLLGWWCVISVVATLGLAAVVRLGEMIGPQMASVGGGALSPTMLALLVTAVYLHWVRRTHQLAGAAVENLPTYYTGERSQPIYASALVAHSLQRRESVGWILLRFVYYLVPLCFVSTYSFFYRQTGILISGCAALLVRRHGLPKVEAFTRGLPLRCRRGGVDPRLAQLDMVLSDIPVGSPEWTYTTLIALIRIQGYRRTRNDLDTFLKSRTPQGVPVSHALVRSSAAAGAGRFSDRF